MSLEVKNLSVHAGQFTLSNVSINIPTGQCGVLMGRSGAGKTTLMEGLCGLRSVEGGSVFLSGKNITHLRPGERGIGLVPQDTVLFPHMTVREHLAFGPTLKRWDKNKIDERVENLGESLGISDLLARSPYGLSGGEGKRIAIGRAIAAKPDLLCLDEALTGLDQETHHSTIALIANVIREENLTTLYITHREDEADALGGRRFQIPQKMDGIVI